MVKLLRPCKENPPLNITMAPDSPVGGNAK